MNLLAIILSVTLASRCFLVAMGHVALLSGTCSLEIHDMPSEMNFETKTTFENQVEHFLTTYFELPSCDISKFFVIVINQKLPLNQQDKAAPLLVDVTVNAEYNSQTYHYHDEVIFEELLCDFFDHEGKELAHFLASSGTEYLSNIEEIYKATQLGKKSFFALQADSTDELSRTANAIMISGSCAVVVSMIALLINLNKCKKKKLVSKNVQMCDLESISTTSSEDAEKLKNEQANLRSTSRYPWMFETVDQFDAASIVSYESTRSSREKRNRQNNARTEEARAIIGRKSDRSTQIGSGYTELVSKRPSKTFQSTTYDIYGSDMWIAPDDGCGRNLDDLSCQGGMKSSDLKPSSSQQEPTTFLEKISEDSNQKQPAKPTVKTSSSSPRFDKSNDITSDKASGADFNSSQVVVSSGANDYTKEVRMNREVQKSAKPEVVANDDCQTVESSREENSVGSSILPEYNKDDAKKMNVEELGISFQNSSNAIKEFYAEPHSQSVAPSSSSQSFHSWMNETMSEIIGDMEPPDDDGDYSSLCEIMEKTMSSGVFRESQERSDYSLGSFTEVCKEQKNIPKLIVDEDRSFQRECMAPSGKLGVVIKSVGNVSVVHRLKEGSPLEGKIFAGDRIIEVNGIDTSHMAARDVTKLMASSSDVSRNLTVLSKHSV